VTPVFLGLRTSRSSPAFGQDETIVRPAFIAVLSVVAAAALRAA